MSTTRTIAALLLGSLLACGTKNAAPPPSTAAAPAAASSSGPRVHRFEKADEWAKVFDDPARDAWQRPAEVVSLLHVAPGSTVADVGTGTGYFLPHLSRAVGDAGHVLALDIEPDMIRYVKERVARDHLANVEARVVPLDDPALPKGAVDRVLIVDTWHHVQAREAYAKKLADGLRPGGAVFIVDFTMDSKMGPPKHHRLSPEQVIAELTAGGLKASVVPEDLPEQYVVKGEK